MVQRIRSVTAAILTYVATPDIPPSSNSPPSRPHATADRIAGSSGTDRTDLKQFCPMRTDGISMNHSRLLIVLLAAVACMGTWIYHDATVAQERAIPISGTQWEYKIMYPLTLAELAVAPVAWDPDADEYTTEVEEKALNKLGAENWELVNVMHLGVLRYHYSFKRPKSLK